MDDTCAMCQEKKGIKMPYKDEKDEDVYLCDECKEIVSSMIQTYQAWRQK